MKDPIVIRQQQLEKIDLSLERWHRRLTRAINAIDLLRKTRKRILRPRPLPPEAREDFNDPLPQAPQPAPADLEIPVYLRRPKSADNEADKQAVAEIIQENDEKKRVKAAASKATRKAAARGELRRMPLQGKAALDFIRAG
jgi:hypothetical protein